MKITGINFGRKNGDNHRNLEKVLAAAEAAGAETTLLDTARMYIGPVDTDTNAVSEDDFPALMDAMLSSDALVIACPVYALSPVGQYKSVVDRLSKALKVPAGTVADKPAGPKYIAYLSLGGAHDHHWVSLCLPMMKLMGAVLGCSEIDEMDTHGRPADPKSLKKMGEAMVEAVAKQDGTYQGDHTGVCPYCHCDFVNILSGTDIICPICGAKGKLVFSDTAVVVEF